MVHQSDSVAAAELLVHGRGAEPILNGKDAEPILHGQDTEPILESWHARRVLHGWLRVWKSADIAGWTAAASGPPNQDSRRVGARLPMARM